ncbi:MAG: thioesterase II family protein [Stackebrandtia sp.]
MTVSNPVLVPLAPRLAPRVRLYCVPYGGAGPEIFRKWGDLLPDSVEPVAVHLPGRGSRADEPCATDPRPLVRILADVIAADTRRDLPVALFGHCVGAILAFETARRLRRVHRIVPLLLAVSALPPPHRYAEEYRSSLFRSLMGGTDVMPEYIQWVAQHIEATPQAANTVGTTLLADILLGMQYRYQEDLPLEADLSVFAGRDDAVAPPEQMDDWESHATGRTHVHLHPGRHLFLNERLTELTAELAADLRSARGVG